MSASETETQEHDLAALSRDALLGTLPREELLELLGALEPCALPAGATVLREGETGTEMYFVLEGSARARRHSMDVETFRPGSHFGELGLARVGRRAATVDALTPVRLGRLTRARFEELAARRPRVGVHLLQGLLARAGDQLVSMTDSVGLLVRERSLPRRTHVHLRMLEGEREVPTGTLAGALLPEQHEGSLVVGALLDNTAVSLSTPLSSDAKLVPLTLRHAEGRACYRRSVGLALLECARRALPGRKLRLGPSVSDAQVVYLEDGVDDAALHALGLSLGRLFAADVPFHVELWTLAEARSYFNAEGEPETEELLRSLRDPTVSLCTCGEVYALELGPLVPRTGMLLPVRLLPHPDGLLLDYGETFRSHLPGSQTGDAVLELEQKTPRFGTPMVREHRAWLAALGITSVGTFNACCVSGRVPQLIRVAEGFHEKRIGAIADTINARRDKVRVICIAGPSSSGKTTFIKRLSVQLEINGLRPLNLSLDDYYVDREKTVRDASGDYDFEALEALDLSLLQSQLGRLLAGERVRTARFDFKSGKSAPEGGPETELHRDHVLLLEGIHGLNPKLLGDAVRPEQAFKIFLHPAATLSFDHLSRVAAADVRLLRRIVRDRHTRNYAAAENIARWSSVRRGERLHIFPFLPEAEVVFDSALVYELAVSKVFADRYLLEVPQEHPSFPTAQRLRLLLDRFVTIYPDHVPPNSLLREFIGGSGFEY